MTGRRSEFGRRLLDRGMDLVVDRAPWLSERAYRAVSTPLQWLDPSGAADAAHARLDGARDRIEQMAQTGRVPRGEPRRLRRDLERTRDDLARIASRLTPVQARALTLRVASYAQALAPLQEPAPAGRAGAGDHRAPAEGGVAAPARRRRPLPRRARDAAVLTGAATTAWAGLLLPAAGTAAVEGTLVAGAATAVGVSAVRSRRARRQRLADLARTLQALDATVSRPGAAPVPGLDRDRRALVKRALASGRLDTRGEGLLRATDTHLDDLLVRLLDDDLDPDVVHLVEATVSRYLPDTIDPLLVLSDPRAAVRGRPAAVEVADQLTSIERALAQARTRPSREHPQTRLLLQGEFLRSKFGRD